MEKEKNAIGHQGILNAIPHRYPFLFVDGILDHDDVNYIVGFKNVSFSEQYVYGCSPDKPRFPESLITECMAQVGAVLVLQNPEHHGKIMLFAAIDHLRFHRAVYPGEQLVSRVERMYIKGTLGKMKAMAHVDGELVAEGEFSYALAERKALG